MSNDLAEDIERIAFFNVVKCITLQRPAVQCEVALKT